MFCTSCGSVVNPDAQFCPKCGRPQGAGPAPVSPPVAWVSPTGVRSQTGRWLGIGWQMTRDDLGLFVVATLLYAICNAAVPLILQGPLCAGFMILSFKKLTGRRPAVGDLFRGFNFFVPALVASLLIAVFVFAGTLACIIPGIVVAAALKFTYAFIVDKRMDFWPAIQASHAIVKQDYFGFTMFLIACVLINLLGVICCIVGLLVTVPMTFCAIAAAYHDIVGVNPATPELA
ncbi:MAG: zinc-ribbon domain-containing protein [Acidobacteria bacterium]|nr:zinc-ribbon domain-containing protein [Acidobacteriota bacterium]